MEAAKQQSTTKARKSILKRKTHLVRRKRQIRVKSCSSPRWKCGKFPCDCDFLKNYVPRGGRKNWEFSPESGPHRPEKSENFHPKEARRGAREMFVKNRWNNRKQHTKRAGKEREVVTRSSSSKEILVDWVREKCVHFSSYEWKLESDKFCQVVCADLLGEGR